MNTQTFPLALPASQSSLYFPASIGFYFAARLSISYLFFQSAPQTGAIVSLVLNLALFGLTLFYIFGSDGDGPIHFPSPVKWVCAFLAVSLVSLSWSATVSVPIALGYWSGMAADVAMVLLLLRYQPRELTAHSLLAGYVLGAGFIAMVAWLSPTMADLRPGDDEFFSPNAIGFTCAFGVFLAQYLAPSKRAWNYMAVFLAVSLLRTLSKTTIIAFLCGQGLLFLRDRTHSKVLRRRVMVGALAVLALFWPLLQSYYVVYTNAGNQAETLTGRLGIWAFVLTRAVEEPWIGHGFHGFRNVIPPFGSFEAWHAHNEILQQFYAYGLLGIVLLFGLYGSFFLHVRRAAPRLRALFTSLLLFMVVRGLGDTERFDLSFPLWAIALLSFTVLQPDPAAEVSA